MRNACPTCGTSLTERIREWSRLHGRPPTSNDWNPKQDGWPSSSLIQRVFGSWSDGLVAAGFPRRRRGAQPGWARLRQSRALTHEQREVLRVRVSDARKAKALRLAKVERALEQEAVA